MIALLTLITFNYHVYLGVKITVFLYPCFSTPSQRLNVLGVSKYQWYHGDAEVGPGCCVPSLPLKKGFLLQTLTKIAMCFKIEWWSLVVSGGPWYLTCFALFCQFSQQNMDGPTNIPSRLAMACRWRSPLIWGVQTAVLVWPHAWRFLVGPWDLCHYR